MKIVYLATSLLFVIVSSMIHAEDSFQTIDQFMADVKKETQLKTGTAIAIVKDGSIVYEKYFGYADIQAKKPVDKNTAFYIASMTKPFFALATLLMEHKGDVKESTSLAELFPMLGFKHIDAETITVKHLLSHTSGVENEGITISTAYSGLHTNALLRQQIANVTPINQHDLGDYNYTNMGYNIVSVWADQFYHQDWQKTLAESVFKPLQLQHTSAYMSDAENIGYEVAKPYSILGPSMTEPHYLSKQDNTMHAAGGMISTAQDLARFLIAQLHEGQVDGHQIFPPEVIAKSHTRIAIADEESPDTSQSAYGWGWQIGQYKDEIIYSHGGGFVGSRTHISFIPAHNIGLVVLTNDDLIGGRLGASILDIAYSELLEKRNISTVAKQRFDALIAAKVDTEESVESFFKVLADRPILLSEEKKEYEGIFSNTLLGEIEIKLLESNELEVTFGNMQTIADGYHNQNSLRADFGGTGQGLLFDILDGEVVGLNVYNEYFKKL